MNTSSPTTAPPELLSRAQLADRLGIDRSTLTRWVREGIATPAFQMPGKTGAQLFTVEEADRLVAEHGKRPPS